MARHHLTEDEARGGLTLPTGEQHVLVLRRHKLVVRLDLDPNEPASRDDRFTLIGGDDLAAPRYKQTKSVADDAAPGDDALDLVFTGLVPDVPYSLEVDPGAEGERYMAFEKIAWGEIAVKRR